MSATVDKLSDPNTLYVGEGVMINGVVLTSGTVVVHGVLEGDISVNELFVGETGTIKGRVTVARGAEILGKAFERLNVKGLLVLRAGCRVDGTVSFGTLQIEQGASITGGISATTAEGADQQAPKAPRKEAAPSPATNGTSARQRLDLSMLDVAPSPMAAAT
jgi:cytoskeletal protein CcmA (bactofilin family)